MSWENDDQGGWGGDNNQGDHGDWEVDNNQGSENYGGRDASRKKESSEQPNANARAHLNVSESPQTQQRNRDGGGWDNVAAQEPSSGWGGSGNKGNEEKDPWANIGNGEAARGGEVGGGDAWGGSNDQDGSNNAEDHQDPKAENNNQYDVENIEIREVDWEKEDLIEPQYAYEEHKDVQELSEEDVKMWRNSWHMTVEASDDNFSIPKPIRSFEESKFPEDILQLIDSSRGGAFDNPTPIQSQGWPLIMTGKDVIGVAQTGSGKTLAFILPGIMHIRLNPNQRKNCPTVMVQAPTRELARQIGEETRNYTAGAKVAHTFGGESRKSQIYSLVNANIIVGTPGRTMDLIGSGNINLRSCTYIVLDEADRMLDMGFQSQIEKIFRAVRPTGRQLLMFTATWPYKVHELAASLFKLNWLKVTIGALQTSANHNVLQEFLFPSGQMEKERNLLDMLKIQYKGKKTLVFVKTKKMADQLTMSIRSHGVSSVALHGDKEQWVRDATMRDFKLGKVCRCVIATDVAQRGLHVDDISLVVNFDFPNTVEDYVHRIGRTARQGRKGTSITMFDMRNDSKHIEELVKVLKEAKQKVPEEFESGNMQNGYYGGGRDYGGGGGNSGVCYAHQRGDCTRGDNCRFSHEGSGGGGGGGGGGGRGADRDSGAGRWEANEGGDEDEGGWGGGKGGGW